MNWNRPLHSCGIRRFLAADGAVDLVSIVSIRTLVISFCLMLKTYSLHLAVGITGMKPFPSCELKNAQFREDKKSLTFFLI